MHTPTTAVTLSGRDFTAFFDGRIEISANPNGRGRIHIQVAPGHSLFVAQQIIQINAGDKIEPLTLPTLDALQGPDFSRKGVR